MKFLRVLCVLGGLILPASALDREAFTFTYYNLNVTIDPGQQRLAVRGNITLRNDSDSPQQDVVLQISSTLHWASIQISGKPAEYVTQTYNSDIDHTGALTEAIITLLRAIAPKQTVEIEVGYEGVIPQDVTRLTRIGVPADTAKHSDWDQISAGFTGVRGIGYVAWYPIATESANMSDARSVSEAAGRWKRRQQGSEILMNFSVSGDAARGMPLLFCSGESQLETHEQIGRADRKQDQCTSHLAGSAVPFFVIGTYKILDDPAATIAYFSEHKSAADDYILALNQVGPSVSVWLGGHAPANGAKPRVIDLPDAKASPFESGNTLLLPLTGDETSMLLMAVQQVARLNFPSPRIWISQGLARYAQVRYIEQEKGRDAALSYLQSHRGALLEAERQSREQGAEHAAERSLVNATDEFYVQAKAMNVWWMLRELVGETAFTAALRNYRPNEDKDAMYMQELLEAQTHRDLTWFFDDWVYRDRGLPELRIDSVYSRPILSGGYMVTVTVENLGGAAAEVPVALQMVTGDATGKLLVPGKSKASVRITAGSAPMKATVNGDGSSPESDMTNNTYKIESLNH